MVLITNPEISSHDGQSGPDNHLKQPPASCSSMREEQTMKLNGAGSEVVGPDPIQLPSIYKAIPFSRPIPTSNNKPSIVEPSLAGIPQAADIAGQEALRHLTGFNAKEKKDKRKEPSSSSSIYRCRSGSMMFGNDGFDTMPPIEFPPRAPDGLVRDGKVNVTMLWEGSGLFMEHLEFAMSCRRPTGAELHDADGYWLPFDEAKEMALKLGMTLCKRPDLTSIFGPNFDQQCQAYGFYAHHKLRNPFREPTEFERALLEQSSAEQRGGGATWEHHQFE